MFYLKVLWRHHSASLPTVIYSELDLDRRETRKVECLSSGELIRADQYTNAALETRLAEVKVPNLEEIASDAEFIPERVSRKEFESVWERAKPA